MDWDKKKKKGFWDEFGFGNFGEEVQRMMEEMMRAFEDPSSQRIDKPIMSGFSMRIGPDGKPQFRKFGNLGFKGIKDSREPFTDVINKGKEIVVIFEMPGVEKKDIDLECAENTLTVKVDNPKIKYHKKVKLPEEVISDKTQATYKNGVLEIRLEKKHPSEPKKSVKIE